MPPQTSIMAVIVLKCMCISFKFLPYQKDKVITAETWQLPMFKHVIWVFFQAGVFKGLTGTHLKAAAIVTSSLKVSPPCGNCRTWLCYSGCMRKGSAPYYGLHGSTDLIHMIACYLSSIHVSSSRLRRHFSPFLWVGPISSRKFWVQLWWPTADLATSPLCALLCPPMSHFRGF